MRLLNLLLLSFLTILCPNASAQTGWFFSHDQMSSSLATKVCQDAYGYIWLGTEYGLNRFDGYHFTHFLHHAADSTSIPANEVTAFAIGHDKTLWVGFSRGLARYDYNTNSFVNYRFPNNTKPRISTLTVASDGSLLIGTAGFGLYRMVGQELTVDTRYYQLGMNGYYSRMAIDKQGNLWCTSKEPGAVRITPRGKRAPQRKVFTSTKGQPLCMDSHNGKLIAVCTEGIATFNPHTQQFEDAGFDLSAMGGSVYIDYACIAQGNIYIASTGWGLGVIARGTRTLKPYHIQMYDIDPRQSSIRGICQDRNGNVWLACYRQGLLLLTGSHTAFHSWKFSQSLIPANSRLLSIIPYGDDLLCALPPSGIYRISSDGHVEGRMHGPSDTRVIYQDRQGQYWLGVGASLYSYVPATGQTHKVMSTEGQSINCIVDDGKRIYASSLGKGLYVYNKDKHTTAHFTMNDKRKQGGSLVNDWIMDMNIDPSGRLWICTSNGVSCLDPRTGRFDGQGWNSLLVGNICKAVAFMRNGNVVIGTSEGLLLYDKKKRKATKFPKSEPLDDKAISDIMTDKSGDLWISTMDGIWQWSHKSRAFIGHISGNGLATKEYWPHLAFHCADDRIGFGTPDGITMFRPDDVRASHSVEGKIHITNVVIGGKQVSAMQNRYHVANNENSITMEFSLLNYRYADNVIFQYRLNGGAWNTTENYSNSVAFNRLTYGDYMLEVRATSNGQVITPVKRIEISVAPPWYLSTDAYLVYAMIIIIAVTAAVIGYGRRKQRELEEAKMRFLINATHDIRSPLTLIMAPLKKLHERVTDPESLRDIATIERNAGRLLTLVGQILDKRRIDKQLLKLRCQETDLVKFTASIISLYRYHADERNISLKFVHPDKADIWIDRNNFDKVVANLLSNAFKFTPDGGEIMVSIKAGDGNVTLAVTDTGSGFTPTSLKHVFDRFYQGENSRSMHAGGTGIGLNLCQALTRMHGGKISAENRKDGLTGAVVKVTLPMGRGHLKPDQIIEEGKHEVPTETKHKQANRNIKLMVVDDDREVAAYIKEELADWYRTEIFPNGKQALEALLKGKYDVVVSDVMMPEMDGIELLKAVKGNSAISDVPVILLTSKAEIADRLEGLRRGADAYIAKPFNMDVLHATIDNVVDNVRRLRGKFSGTQAGGGRVENVEVKGNDDALMDRIMKSVNKNMDNSDFNVEQLCQEVGISRTQLHRKMKEIAGLSTSDFIRNLRLDQAAKLLAEGKINVTQVAYSVGFNNSAHFSTVFKKHFGMSPTEYAEKNANPPGEKA